MTEKNTLNPAALKAARDHANGKRGFTQEQLAEKIGCSKDTVSRWERGKGCRVRAHLRKPLCEVLGVEWDTLTTPPNSEPDPWRISFPRMQHRVPHHVPPALLLVAKRYGIRPHEVLSIAPLLFLIIAERSLLERRRRLDEIYAVREDAEHRLREKSAHLGGLVAVFDYSGDDLLEEEEKSLRERDIFGSLIESDDHEGPFVHFIRSLMEGLPQDAVTDISGEDMIESYQIADDTLRELTDITEGDEGDEILHQIRIGGINLTKCLNAKEKLSDTDYRQWLKDARAEVEESRHKEIDIKVVSTVAKNFGLSPIDFNSAKAIAEELLRKEQLIAEEQYSEAEKAKAYDRLLGRVGKKLELVRQAFEILQI